MKTINPIPNKASSPRVGCEYTLVLIAKNDSEDVYGIAAQDSNDDAFCVKELGSDKELAASIVDTLNYHRVPYVHFLDIVNDLINE